MRRRLIVDSELLTLFIVGTRSRHYISRHKKLKSYIEEDYDLLLGIVSTAAEVVVTPHALAETSNLLGYIQDPARTKIFEMMRALIPGFSESQTASRKGAERDEFLRLGLTDCMLLESAGDETVLLTSDLGLYLAAQRSGREAQNFNHLRKFG